MKTEIIDILFYYVEEQIPRDRERASELENGNCAMNHLIDQYVNEKKLSFREGEEISSLAATYASEYGRYSFRNGVMVALKLMQEAGCMPNIESLIQRSHS